MGLFDIFKSNNRLDYQIFNVTDEDFERNILQRSFKSPILADFWADWCAPCRQLGPVLERIATSNDAPFRLAKVRTDDAPVASQKFKIQSIPAVKLFRNGAVVGQFQGLQMEHNIRRFVAETMEKPAPQPRIQAPTATDQRIGFAKKAIQQGDAFLATLVLRDMEDASAQTLLPLAQFMWDATDGDILSGNRKLDELYLDAADAIEEGRLEDAQPALSAAQQKAKGDQQTRISDVLLALERFRG